MGSQVRVLYCPPSSCTQIDAAAKSPEVSTTSGLFAPIFSSVTKRCQNGLWQIRWTCTFTQGILSRFSEDFSGKRLFFVLGKVWNFDWRFCWSCRTPTPSTDASALAGCATFQTLKPQTRSIPFQDETTAYWRCWDARKQSTRCQRSGWSFIGWLSAEHRFLMSHPSCLCGLRGYRGRAATGRSMRSECGSDRMRRAYSLADGAAPGDSAHV